MSFQNDFGRRAKSFVHLHVTRIPLGPTSLRRRTVADVQLSVVQELWFAAKSFTSKSGNCQGSLAASIWHSCYAVTLILNSFPPFFPYSHPHRPSGYCLSSLGPEISTQTRFSSSQPAAASPQKGRASPAVQWGKPALFPWLDGLCEKADRLAPPLTFSSQEPYMHPGGQGTDWGTAMALRENVSSFLSSGQNLPMGRTQWT